MNPPTVDHLVNARTFEWAELQRDPDNPPRAAGCYAWWFREQPGVVSTTGVVGREGLMLLYVGISPRTRAAHLNPSTQNLRTRIRYHYRGNAEGSTLRLTLGCLLSDRLGIQLRRVGSGTRMTFNAGEAALSGWMLKNALVGWVEHPYPEQLEQAAIGCLSLPLNLEHNKCHAFNAQLAAIRAVARQRARDLPIWVP
jgi:hypothetical protein